MSTDLALVQIDVPPMTPEAILCVREIEEFFLASQPQIDLKMEHRFHAGMYARTCRIPAGFIITGALIKIATMLVIDGDCYIWLGGEGRHIQGRAIVNASAGRKQAFRAAADTWITMLFTTQAKTAPEAEREFTDEWRNLAPGCAETVISGEPA